jgi:hypothetical protein
MNEENQVEADTIRERIARGDHKKTHMYKYGRLIGYASLVLLVIIFARQLLWA